MNKNERIVIPGEQIKSQSYRNREENYLHRVGKGNYVVTHLGVAHILNKRVDVIPYKNVYIPKIGDYVVGVVTSYAPNGWVVEIGSYTKAFLPANEMLKEGKFDPKRIDLDRYLKIGDIVGAIIMDLNRYSNILLTLKPVKEGVNPRHLGKLTNYYIIKVHTTKLPRIIGKKGSMVKIIKKKIDGDLIIAQNGVIMYRGDYEKFMLLKRILNIIIKYTYASGLTGKVAEILGVNLSEIESNENSGKGDENK